MNQYDFTAPFEGSIPHLYLDTRNHMTCGVGLLLTSLSAAAALPFAPIGALPGDWARVSAMPGGLPASRYGLVCKASLPSAAMRRLFETKCGEFELKLRAIYEWDALPEAARVALMDMAYNLGAGALATKWPSLNAAVSSGNWTAASKQCRRQGVQPERNIQTAALFASCARAA